MDKNSVIKMKKEVNVTDLSGEKVMVDFESGKYYMIKGVGNDIWDMIQTEISVGSIIDKLLSEYEVSEAECEKSVYEFLGKLEDMDFITA